MAALPQLKLEQVWKPSRSGFDTDVTLVTQLSLERYFNIPICLVSTTVPKCRLHVFYLYYILRVLYVYLPKCTLIDDHPCIAFECSASRVMMRMILCMHQSCSEVTL